MMTARRLLAVAALAALAACADRTVTDPRSPGDAPDYAKGGGGGGGDPTVTGTNPTDAPQDTTLNIRVLGSNFDRNSRADLALGGVVGPKVHTNSTAYVSSTELIANVTIAVDADTGVYDVIVTTSTGKKGIGTEMFEVRVKGPKPPTPFGPAILYSDGGMWRVTDATGTHSADLGLARMTGWARWARGGAGVAGDPYRVATDTALNGQSCNRLIISDVDTVGGQPRVAARRNLDLPPLHMACFLDWSPEGDTIVYGAAQDASVGNGIWLVPTSGGVPVRAYASANQVFAPDWSPDGAAIAFRELTPSGTALRVLNRASGTVTTLVSAGTFDIQRAPDWSPDGMEIAFTVPVRRGSRWDLYVYTLAVTRNGQGDYVAAGSPQRRFLGDAPSYSPDGTQMIVSGLYLVDIASGTRTHVVTGDWASWRK
jgi:hypothetical protein